MSYLLFMDESGHDHRSAPYEVHGGIALHASRVWPFVQAMRALERDAFGVSLHEFKSEIKGAKLLDKDRYKWAAQEETMPDLVRRQQAKAFLQNSSQQQKISRGEFTAYGQACLAAAQGIFALLREQGAILFASAVPRGAAKPPPTHNPEFLRRDFVYLLERYCYILQEQSASGLLVMDSIENSEDRRLTGRLERFFSLTQVGRERAQHIVPTPLFVTSDMTYAIQAADLCIYCLNWGFRLPERGMDAPTRPEIARDFGGLVNGLRWKGFGKRAGASFDSYGICYVPNLY